MIRPIDLDQFPKTSPAVTHLVSGWLLGSLRFPDIFCDHDLVHDFSEEMEFIYFGQLLVGQRRPKILLLLLDQIQDFLGYANVQAVIARFAAAALLAGR